MRLVVFSICLNEENTIGEVLQKIPEQVPGITQVIKLVIDDGSTDRTAQIAKDHGAVVCLNGARKGLAYSFQVAIEKVLSMGADLAVNIDGDLQYDPADILRLVKPVIDGTADFVSADRFTAHDGNGKRRPENMPVGKYWGNRVGSWLVGRLSGMKFNDVTSGFRAYNRKSLLTMNINSRYTYTQESFQVLASRGLKIVSVPVTVRYFNGRKSRVVTSVLRFIFGSAVNILRAYRDLEPLLFFFWFGLTTFSLGVASLGFLGMYFIRTGTFTPYKYLGFIGVFFVSLSFVVWVVGLVGDMLDRVLNNQEKIMYLLKVLKYGDKEN